MNLEAKFVWDDNDKKYGLSFETKKYTILPVDPLEMKM